MKSKYSAHEKMQIVLESLTENTFQVEVCSRHGIYPVQLTKRKEQFIQERKTTLFLNRKSNSRDSEIEELKKTIGDQSLVIEGFKNAPMEVKMIIINDFRPLVTLRRIHEISGIPLFLYYYKQKKRNVKCFDSSVKQKIIRIASERPTHGYRRVWAAMRSNGIHLNRKTVGRLLKQNHLSPPPHEHKGRVNLKNLYKPKGPDQLWHTDITCLPTQNGMT